MSRLALPLALALAGIAYVAWASRAPRVPEPVLPAPLPPVPEAPLCLIPGCFICEAQRSGVTS